MPVTIVFCEDPLSSGTVDEAYAAEAVAAAEVGFDVALVSYEQLVHFDDPRAAVRRVESGDELRPAVYRGWMMTPARYSQLHGALRGKGLELINSPAQYKHGHWLPESYPRIVGSTSRTVHLAGSALPGWDVLGPFLAGFKGAPVVLKDYVKSQKYYWKDWEEADYSGAEAPPDEFDSKAGEIGSCFFTMDVAKTTEGHWIIVELGDAQVAGLPECVDPIRFYRVLIKKLVP